MMAGEAKSHEEKHLARNVPRDFNAVLERQRHALSREGDLSRKSTQLFNFILRELSKEEFADSDQVTLFNELFEIRLRYLVLLKTLDQSVAPTPIMRSLNSVKARTAAALREMSDEDRDNQVKELTGVETFTVGLEAFGKANMLAERAAIVTATIREYDRILKEMAEFFDHKADKMRPGNTTKFGLIYAINALSAIFEKWNRYDRTATINRTTLGIGNERVGEIEYTGPFIRFVEAFFRWTDDSQLDWRGDTLRDRIRRLTIERKRDVDLHKLLDGVVDIPAILEFMKRAEELRQ